MKEGLTFDDVLLVPKKSAIIPREVNLKTKFSKNIKLNIPLVSAAMDTVTDHLMAIAMAKEGGIGVIHKNMSIEKQAEEVKKVKRYESGMIQNPLTVRPNHTLAHAKGIMNEYNISGLPVVNDNYELVGIITKRDLQLEDKLDKKVKTRMTYKNLITAKYGITIKKAKEILKTYKIEKLPIIDNKNKLIGLITIRDILNTIEYPLACKDKYGRLRVAAAIGSDKDSIHRAFELKQAGVDAIIIDTAHAHSYKVINIIKQVLKKIDNVDIIVGNIATSEAAADLSKMDIAALKVGIGPGSICTTRVIAGIGVPQLTAIMNVVKKTRGKNLPIIADGGIKYSGDAVKALAAGASSVMIGSLLAGTDESPGDTILMDGRKFKVYRGMGSLDAMLAGSHDRYFQDLKDKLVPEGIVGRVPYNGKASEIIFQIVGGIKSGMGYCGAKNIPALQKNAEFIKISSAGLKESHPHDIIITKESPNYEPPKE